MNITLWIVAVTALVTAAVAVAAGRRTARQLADLTDLYWRLKYEHGELKAQVNPRPPALPAPSSAFVPLSQVKRGDRSP